MIFFFPINNLAALAGPQGSEEQDAPAKPLTAPLSYNFKSIDKIIILF